MWGLFPIYWKQLAHISSFEILCHRVLWSFFFYGAAIVVLSLFSKEKKSEFILSLRFDRKLWLKLLLSSFLITGNWFLYIYAVNSGQILQGSLAYYISPLLTVLVGTLFFKEQMNSRVRLALSFCGLGVLLLIFGPSVLMGELPHVPWLALSLAFSFFGYGFIKKSVSVSPIVSSFIEGLFFILPSAYFIFFSPTTTLSAYTMHDWLYFIFGGAVTGLPLIFFSYGAQKLPMATIGFFQYLSPTLQLMTAVLIYSEDFGLYKIAAFSCIWIGVAFYVSQLLTGKGNQK